MQRGVELALRDFNLALRDFNLPLSRFRDATSSCGAGRLAPLTRGRPLPR